VYEANELTFELPGGGAGGAWGIGGGTFAAAGGRGACDNAGGDGVLKRHV